MDITSESKTPVKRRRYHCPAFRAQVVKEAEQPGVSVASVALRHKLYVNLIHKWRRDQRRNGSPEPAAPGFIALPGPAAHAQGAGNNIRIELNTNTTTIKIDWPHHQASTLVQWLKDIIT